MNELIDYVIQTYGKLHGLDIVEKIMLGEITTQEQADAEWERTNV